MAMRNMLHALRSKHKRLLRLIYDAGLRENLLAHFLIIFEAFFSPRKSQFGKFLLLLLGLRIALCYYLYMVAQWPACWLG